jgi:hypothetical protein
MTTSNTAGTKDILTMINLYDEGQGTMDTMAASTEKVVLECQERYGALWDLHNFSFSAQDDFWANSWGERTGLPMSNHKEKWGESPC